MPSSPARYAVIGNPVAHSRSPAIHALFAAQTGQAITYERLLAPVDGFESAVAAFRAAGGAGLNVTLPFKQAAHAYAQRLTDRAAVAGAVNTLAFDGGSVLGDNTDGAGLVADIEQRVGLPLRGLSVLLASDAADWITGACIPMDGGNLAMNAGGGLLAPIIRKHLDAAGAVT